MTSQPDSVENGGNRPVLTVGELSRALKRTVEEAFAWVSVRGEVSGFKRAASGHLYFTLKDADAVLDAVCWRGVAARLSVRPEDGLEVIATGRVSIYPGRSRYQIVVERLALSGEGALLKLLEERRRLLAGEGLFDEAHKRAPPFLPARIGVITSPTGAVLRDILHRVRARFPRPILLWPVTVQGESAAGEIAEAIAGFNRLSPKDAVPRPDVLIVARGGGSLEDLWPFNEEAVVRAAAASEIPLISAVGHETDTTLIDLAADRRAPTPTAAAEMAVPVRADLKDRLGALDHRLGAATRRRLVESRVRIEGLARGLPQARSRLTQAAQRLDDWSERLAPALGRGLEARRQALARLRPLGPRQLLVFKRRELVRAGEGLDGGRLAERLARGRADAAALADRLVRAKEAALRNRATKVESVVRLLESCSYKGVLARGYAVVRDRHNKPLPTAAAVVPGTALSLEFQDGRAAARAAARAADRPSTRPGSGAREDRGEQGSLW